MVPYSPWDVFGYGYFRNQIWLVESDQLAFATMTTPPTTGNAGYPRNPTSIISVGTSLSTPMVTLWHRGKAKIDRLVGGPPSETSITHESTCRVPYEIVEKIITYLIHDLYALKACSLTCRSWHAVAVPHIYHTLVLGRSAKLKVLSKLHKRGLISFVNIIQVGQWDGKSAWFAPKVFNPRDLRYFSSFANVHTLDLQKLEIHRFIPNVERYFGHFSQTLRSIKLYRPCCTPRQQSHFLSLFSNLDNIEICGTDTSPIIPVPDRLVPFSAPKLRGRLVLRSYNWSWTWEHLISAGGLRFRHIDLRDSINCAQVLLDACAETLETLQLFATDGWYPIDKLDLSRLRVLRSLLISGLPMSMSGDYRRHSTVLRAFPTVTSPVFSELVIILPDDTITYLPKYVTLFERLGKMNQVRPFNLVFSLVLSSSVSEASLVEARRKLRGTLDLVAAKGLLNFLDSPPTIR